MKNRCQNPNVACYKIYGARGISVCDRWMDSFENFIADVGQRPSPRHSIERINNDGNYEPGNVRWATKKEQQNNRRNNVLVGYNGEKKTLAQWVEQFGLKYDIVSRRLKRNWPVHEAFFTPRIKQGLKLTDLISVQY